MSSTGRAPGGTRTGGRTKGTPNKKTRAAIELLKASRYCAITELVEIARQAKEEGDIQTRLAVATTLIRYSYPALKAIDLSVAGGDTPMQLVIATGVPTESHDEMPEDVRELMAKARRQLDG